MNQRRVHCYYRQHFMMTASERAAVLTMFTRFAAENSLELGNIFTDTVETGSSALQEMREILALGDARLIAVPSLLHLDSLGEHDRVMREFTDSGIAVIVADLSFDQGPVRSTACDSSSQKRPLPRSPGAVRNSSEHRAGTPSQAGERVHSDRTLCPARRSTPKQRLGFGLAEVDSVWVGQHNPHRGGLLQGETSC